MEAQKENYLTEINELLCSIKNDPSLAGKVTEQSNFIEDFGIDSLDIVDFMLGLESQFDIEVDFDAFDFDNLTSAKRLLAYILAHSTTEA
ncbi:phosphopantetheine-binding protein [Pseudoalteromonas luteoviolacea]|uniref:Carrier domain-containing protein n=1 Tax=Pseudoalteromonas luteoviolacea DSM 6061 TaxID=1365250 RepID=A0A166YTJ9_9GAMM|nr:phosphopantetheine-binding protein [Pseudoalteromonas luteoviolacea]KZN43506.1 hypothetical protein N475_08875 [Pseudoalteromonas luteoviolacea DSM 6061]KZN57346.1 hypothetical protein N474_08020 [Pseudoalteromonas luteoviolacea CPMOR-2]MBE0388061.1 hypothetical protein [Pseudoalteromonas luteoviolacea DSM 6061]TQF72754.1 acyl carrier protein [Pseudoalteromonas luteoviolacea]